MIHSRRPGWMLACLALFAAPAVAEDTGCASATEVLNWTSQLVADIALNDGPATESHARFLLEATNKADEAARDAGWPDDYNGVLAELGYVAATIADNGGAAETAQASAIRDYGGALAATATVRWGLDVVPAIPATPVGSPDACGRVIDALRRLKEVLPAISRGGGGFSGALILAASVVLRDAVAEATAAGWHPDVVTLLTHASDDVAAVSDGKLKPTPAVAADLIGVGSGVELEARAICIGQDVPRLASGS